FSSEVSWIKRLDEFPNLVITQTMSKAYGMAGIRVGSCFASEEIIEVLNKIKPPYNINTLSQQKAIKRLGDISRVKKEVQRIKEQKVILEKKLLEVFFVKKVYPSEANFLLVKVDDASLRYRQLVKKGVIVRNRSSQPQCENTLRLTVGTSEENRILFKALNSIQP
ncbi:MAG: aminotransferase class I/II-fold pyridoxal phosphate-dependent enzyme, partial [Flavobacteriaceae bacterium]|nr:aminotransferase class I/II-fold pyridoxal phosphate-dependent enzyme [Flavobacteriaceae bacterium]